MKYSIIIKDKIYTAEIREEEGIRMIFWEGKPVNVDCNLKHANPCASMLIEGRPYESSWKRQDETYTIDVGRHSFDVQVRRGEMRGDRKLAIQQKLQEEVVSAPMPGLVVAVNVQPGQEVKRGEPLLILEAMKMENELRSPVNGCVRQIHIKPGNKVEKGERLIVLQK